VTGDRDKQQKMTASNDTKGNDSDGQGDHQQPNMVSSTSYCLPLLSPVVAHCLSLQVLLQVAVALVTVISNNNQKRQ